MDPEHCHQLSTIYFRIDERSDPALETFLEVQRRGPAAFRRLLASLKLAGKPSSSEQQGVAFFPQHRLANKKVCP